MKTLKITIKETVKTKDLPIEINLPCYRKDKISHFKINEQGECTEVQKWSIGDTVIQSREPESAFEKSTEESTEKEFNKAFKDAVKKLK